MRSKDFFLLSIEVVLGLDEAMLFEQFEPHSAVSNHNTTSVMINNNNKSLSRFLPLHIQTLLTPDDPEITAYI